MKKEYGRDYIMPSIKTPYNFEITDKSFYAFNMYYNLAQIITESFKCYIDEIEKRKREGLIFSLPLEFQSVEELKEEVNKIIEGFEILANDEHELSLTKEGSSKIDYALNSFAKLFPTFWI